MLLWQSGVQGLKVSVGPATSSSQDKPPLDLKKIIKNPPGEENTDMRGVPKTGFALPTVSLPLM